MILTRLKLRRKNFGLRWVGRLQVFFIAGLMLVRIGRGWWTGVGTMSISRENLNAKEWRAKLYAPGVRAKGDRKEKY